MASPLETEQQKIEALRHKFEKLGPNNAPQFSFATDPHGKNFMAYKGQAEASLAGLPSAAVTSAERKDFTDALNEVQSQVAAQYKRWSEGDFSTKPEYKAACDKLDAEITKLNGKAAQEVKDFAAEQKKALTSLQGDKQLEAAKSIAQSLDNQYQVKNSLAMARKLKYTSESIFEELNAVDEEALKRQINNNNTARLTALDPDDLLEKKVKKILDKEHKLFHSVTHPDVTIERTQHGWRPLEMKSGKDNFDGYVEAYEETLDIARIEDPNAVFEMSLDRNILKYIRTADEIEKRILSALVAAQEKGVQVELDHDLKTHLLNLKQEIQAHSKARQALSNELGVVDTIDKIFELEKSLKKPKMVENIVGKNATEWSEKLESKSTELDKITPPKGESMLEQKQALETKGIPPENVVNELATQLTNSLPGTSDEKVAALSQKLNDLDAKIVATRGTADLMQLQVNGLAKAADIQAKNEEFNSSPELRSDAHVQKVERLMEKNAGVAAEIKLEAEVIKQAITAQGGGVPTAAVDAALTAADTKLSEIAGVNARHSELHDSVQNYKEKQVEVEEEQGYKRAP